jgi:hypothetical protein
VSVKGDGESVRRTPVGAGRGLGPGGQVRRMFRGLRRRLRGNHERRVRHSVFTQLRRVSIPPRAPQLNCSSKKCAIGSHVRLHAPRSLNAPQRSSTLFGTRPALLARRSARRETNPGTRRSARREETPDGRSWCRTVRTRFPVRSSAAPCQLPPPHPPPPPPPPQDDDPPPQDEPPLQEELPVEQPPPPPEPELPAHQLCLDRRERRLLPLVAADTSPMTTSTTNTARMMPTIMAPPSFRSPEAAPRGLCFLPVLLCVFVPVPLAASLRVLLV